MVQDIIKCLVVDDEPIARAGILEHIKKIDFLSPLGECRDAAEATNFMANESVDVLFLDIQMPLISGIDFARTCSQKTLVVFTTAYAEYALAGFELAVLDYLVKPISFARFLKTALKIKDEFEKQRKRDREEMDFFFIKEEHKIEKINLREIVYIEGLSNYVIIHTETGKKHITYLTLKSLEESLPAGLFIRIHKSYIVSVLAVQTIDTDLIMLENVHLPIGKRYKKKMLEAINNRLIMRD